MLNRHRAACENADWKSNEGGITSMGKPSGPGRGKKGPEDCYIQKNVKNDEFDDVCMATSKAD